MPPVWEPLSEQVKLLCRHLIGLSWYEGDVDEAGNFTRKPDYHTASAFVADIAGKAWIVTAGHVVIDHWKRCREKENWKATKHRVWDIWSPHTKVKEPVPYDFLDPTLSTVPLQNFKRGIDLALIPLDSYLFQFLDQSMAPFMRADWIDSYEHDYVAYYIVGTPNDLLHQDIETEGNRNRVTTYERPTIVAVEPIEDHGIESDCRQFVAKIHPSFPIEDIGGMSGGPILGFRHDGDGNLKYWPVAVQSRWLLNERIVIGTYLSPWLRLAEEYFLEKGTQPAK